MKRCVTLLLAVVLLVCALPVPVGAEDAPRLIDGNALSAFSRTKEALFERWQTADIPAYEDIYEEGHAASFTAPYSGGVVKMEVLEAVRRNLNYYRWLIGSPEITVPPVQRQDLQNASVLQALNLRDRENGVGLTHDLWKYPKPDDMDQAFYDSAVNAVHNIISTYGLRAAVRGFFSESVFTYTNGHRTALLSPYTYMVDFGLGGAIYGDVTAHNITPEDGMDLFAAYPAPGWFPMQDLTPASDWDLYLNPLEFQPLPWDGTADVTGRITALATGETIEYAIEKGNLEVHPNALFFRAPPLSGTWYEGSYRVEVFGLKDSEDLPVTVTYTVNFYDKFESVRSPIAEIRFGAAYKNGLTVDERDPATAQDMMQGALPTFLTVLLESGSLVKIPVTGWTFGEKQYTYFPGSLWGFKAYPQVDKTALPGQIADPEKLEEAAFSVMMWDEPSPDFTLTPQAVSAAGGQTVTLTVSHSDDPDQIRWYRMQRGQAARPVEPDDRITLEGGTLTITAATAGDAGYYFAAVEGSNWWNFYYVGPLVPVDIDGALRTVRLGDINADGAVNAADALEALQHSVRLKSLDGQALWAADVNGDGAVNSVDALLILQVSVRLIDRFPAEE